MYRHSQLFNDEQEPRSVHLAMDLWVPQGTPVFSPLPGRVHSFQNNDHLGDYGPTIILEHELQGLKFFTLYGHLSRVSLVNLKTSETIRSGQQIAKLGSQNENGSWPPHLHFQIISDMMGKKGDFPGVASISEKDYYLGICPDPNLILRLPAFFRKQF
ncbi:MAG: peptidoglycan DD-metalloendopeptidase family protein [Candidatus Doudnabacteria bacterium]|nr:peptidoglycan DD-metalloendopeptidase family protein [Candidatus Doudnabacteria bacterium]